MEFILSPKNVCFKFFNDKDDDDNCTYTLSFYCLMKVTKLVIDVFRSCFWFLNFY